MPSVLTLRPSDSRPFGSKTRFATTVLRESSPCLTLSNLTTLQPSRGTGDRSPSLVAPYLTREVVVRDWQSTRLWRAPRTAVNRLMRAWLRSGWHRPVSSTMMVLTFEGVRSGRTYSFPVSYAEDPEGLMTFTRFSWSKNFHEERLVSLRLRGREARGTAVAVRDPEVVAERFAYYLRCNPHDGRYFGVRVGRDGREDQTERPVPARTPIGSP
jgi:hypothetical protein